jgi:hypothetical protein
MDEDRLEVLRCRFNFSNKFVVKRINKGGGLVLFWRQDFNLSICSYSPSHIDTIVDKDSDHPWWLNCFYGALETHLRELVHGTSSVPSMVNTPSHGAAVVISTR